MDEFKNKYDNMINKLLDLIEKEKLLDKVDEDIENNLNNRSIYNDELKELEDKLYNMKHGVIVDKSRKCLIRALLFSWISGLLIIYVEVIFPSLWFAVLYLILNIIAHHNMYGKKINDRDYMLGELKGTSEYISLKEHINNKKNELNKLDEDYENLTNQSSELLLEIGYLNTMIYGFIEDEEIQRGINEALAKGTEIDIKYVENKGLVRRRVKKNIDKKKDE